MGLVAREGLHFFTLPIFRINFCVVVSSSRQTVFECKFNHLRLSSSTRPAKNHKVPSSVDKSGLFIETKAKINCGSSLGERKRGISRLIVGTGTTNYLEGRIRNHLFSAQKDANLCLLEHLSTTINIEVFQAELEQQNVCA